jgi:tetratricopeptide (TPR) repeat protein
MPGVFALYGDIRTALELKSRNPPARVPATQLSAEFSEALLASAQGQFDEAEQHLATVASIMRDFASPRGDADCLNGFAKVAVDRGDYARASRLLAAVKASAGPQDSPFDRPFATSFVQALIYDHCTAVLRDVLDPESARITQAEGSALSLKEALDAELVRSRRTTVGNPVD